MTNKYLRTYLISLTMKDMQIQNNTDIQMLLHLQFLFFKDFIFFSLFFFSPRDPQYIVVYSSLWVLLVVACGTLPQRGLMSSAMSAPRIRTNETLVCLQWSARTQLLSHRASPTFAEFLKVIVLKYSR